MENILNEIIDKISANLFTLSWKCSDCTQTDVCEDQPDQGPRYCWRILRAAILGEESFEVPNKG